MPTLYLVISASAVDRGFSVAAGAGVVFSESDIVCNGLLAKGGVEDKRVTDARMDFNPNPIRSA
jgi:hypothetical protein